MRKITRSVLCGLLPTLAIASLAPCAPGAQTYYSSGVTCRGETYNDRYYAEVSQWGVQNDATDYTPIHVHCPGRATLTSNTAVKAIVYDRTSDLSPGDLHCTAYILNPDGNPVVSSYKATYSVTNSDQTLDFNISGAGHLDFYCTLPAKDVQNGFSHITSLTWNN